MSGIKKIGVFTSGGDSPGMNAAIRAVVRSALYYNLEVVGIKRGYEGMILGEFEDMDRKSVANIIQRGGTILRTARSADFKTKAGREQAYQQLKSRNVDALVAIGGDGTFTGAKVFGEEFDFPILGLPGTIDNDLFGTDFTIGYDTAINNVVDAVDRIRDTAESHSRLFIVEVMGRDCGLIALRSGIGVGAESIFIPETKTDMEAMMHRLEISRKDKMSKILIVAEGEGDSGGAVELAERVKQRFPQYDTRVSILGHIQRGGKPTCMDRVLASRLGVAAVENLITGRRNEMVGLLNGKIAFTSFDHAIKHNVEINKDLFKIVDILSL
ncbi:6-phosphofructokinase [Pedobacter arcticus]|uniref:6-phosphofructokinase n=1 Tax=Pedobacter arcticus TaxID=752140 RepID=UPI00030333B4|nr:6-phosphofructokinase [Pedobacter arcticus]